MLCNELVIVLNKPSVRFWQLLEHFFMTSSSIANASQGLDFSIPERLYGRFAMIIFDIMIISYSITGQIVPGIF